MMKGKPEVYSHFVSHDDEVTRLPKGSTLLAGNDYSHVQAAEIRHKKGVFWGLQYHPEYDLHEMARLMVAREKKLTEIGFFRGHEDFQEYVDRLEELHSRTRTARTCAGSSASTTMCSPPPSGSASSRTGSIRSYWENNAEEARHVITHAERKTGRGDQEQGTWRKKSPARPCSR